jgi:predicted PurR-regulated permease PerM
MSSPDQSPKVERGVATRSRGKLLALAVATGLALFLCYLLAWPFVPAIVWSTTVAVVTRPYCEWLERWLKSRNAAALISAATVTIAVLTPLVLIGYVAVQQFGKAVEEIQSPETQEKVGKWLAEHPRLERVWTSVSDNFNPAEKAPELIGRLRPGAVAAVSTPLYIGLQLAITIYMLFFLYRDKDDVLESVRHILPLTHPEVDRLFRRVDDALHATIFGTLTVAVLQGTLGGVMLWLLGVPGAALWGVVMVFVAMIPTGTFTVWGPATIYLFLEGHWGRALILLGWGGVAVGLIDNFLYPVLVGQRLRLHTVVTFVAVVGGLAAFGFTGVVLGPVVVTITVFLLETWRRRTEHGASAERV